jgi:putative aminopeptidase FrvX
MNVKQKFLELTSKTYPHGTEHNIFPLLPNFLKSDEFGNLYHQIGENPSTMFTSHLDTASYVDQTVKHVFDGDMIYTDGKSILGADDKAGVVVLLYMIEHNIPGLYFFFVGEERGCIGSRKVASSHKNNPLTHINKVISFDRRGYNSVITHQLSGRSCSNEFAKELSIELNEKSKNLFDKGFEYEPDSTGIYTDSAQFIDIYSECTNISVGYHNEHSHHESQNIEHLRKLCETVVKIDWEILKNYRNQSKFEYDDEDDYYYGIGYSKSYPKTYDYNDFEWDEPKPKQHYTFTILDTEYFGNESDITMDLENDEIVKVKLHPQRIMTERSRISHLLDSLEVDYDDIRWDGNYATITQTDCQDITLTRKEIVEYISNFNDWILTEIKYNRNYNL